MTERLAECDGEGARYVSRDALQGEIDVDVEDVGDGVDEPDKDDGEESCAKETGSAEEQNDAGDVSKGHERVRWKVDGPLRGDDEDEDGLIADVDGSDGDGEDDKTPQAALHLPLMPRQARRMSTALTSGMIMPMDLSASMVHSCQRRPTVDQMEKRPRTAKIVARPAVVPWREACDVQHGARAYIRPREE